MIRTSAPGKLFIAGEYAVVESGYPAILVAVDRFIRVSLMEAYNRGRISSHGREPLLWLRKGERISPSQPNKSFAYVLSSIDMVERYARELGRRPRFYNVDISSELETDDGIKYGLGSSAVVTVATIRALCTFYDISISNIELFKLSALASLAVNKNGSCGDIGASIYGGWIALRTFDRDWVLERAKDISLNQLLEERWPKLSIEPLSPPGELELAVGWTGRPASTANLLERVANGRNKDGKPYEKFLYDSKRCVDDMIHAFRRGNISRIKEQTEANRGLLIRMGEEFGIRIETPLLTKLCDIAQRFGGSAKISGAGGGDCGIAIFDSDRHIVKMIDEWKNIGIAYLPLKVYEMD
ncbi:MAG: phosphomevalonate kinase [Tissierellia bacterium]|nr:phosphomevalonate kinase [Tissierellia bacterium]